MPSTIVIPRWCWTKFLGRGTSHRLLCNTSVEVLYMGLHLWCWCG
jgi:hypothetical protein